MVYRKYALLDWGNVDDSSLFGWVSWDQDRLETIRPEDSCGQRHQLPPDRAGSIVGPNCNKIVFLAPLEQKVPYSRRHGWPILYMVDETVLEGSQPAASGMDGSEPGPGETKSKSDVRQDRMQWVLDCLRSPLSVKLKQRIVEVLLLHGDETRVQLQPGHFQTKEESVCFRALLDRCPNGYEKEKRCFSMWDHHSSEDVEDLKHIVKRGEGKYGITFVPLNYHETLGVHANCESFRVDVRSPIFRFTCLRFFKPLCLQIVCRCKM
jgi:hypothetical protein